MQLQLPWGMAIFVIAGIATCSGLVGYDCGAPSLNLTTLSLLEIGECDIPTENVTTKEVDIRLLQRLEYESINVIQCKIRVERVVSHCGMHSHTSAVQQGFAVYLEPITRRQCDHLHLVGVLHVGDKGLITGITGNSTTTKSLTIAGDLRNDGTCTGVSYSDPYGSWDNVVVQAQVEVTVQDYYVSVHMAHGEVRLPSGQVCQYSKQQCEDREGGPTFWDVFPPNECKFKNYGILYNGKATKIWTKNQAIYSLASNEITFAIAATGLEHVCGQKIITTEHPKLVIYENTPRTPGVGKPMTIVENMDLMTYVNSKFVYFEKFVGKQFVDLYRDVLEQRCELEKRVLQNALVTAVQSPYEFAYHLMKGPGYMAVIAGEVVHIIKCVAVEVAVRNTQECYVELPVKRNNQSEFLTPKTRIITATGTQTNCNPFLPSMYNLDGKWYKFSPNATDLSGSAPIVITPMSRPTWTYTSPKYLARSGIYSSADLEKLREHIMFPAERTAILNTIARGTTGQDIKDPRISLVNMLDEESISRIFESYWDSLWSGLTRFGIISAGFYGIWVLYQLIKMIIDTLVQAYALHRVYGWSIFLFGSIWSSITNLLLHLSRGPRDTDTEMTSVQDDKDDPPPSAPSISTNENQLDPERNQPLRPAPSLKVVTNTEDQRMYPAISTSRPSTERTFGLDV